MQMPATRARWAQRGKGDRSDRDEVLTKVSRGRCWIVEAPREADLIAR
ncbi:MAG: hypothetical protein ACP5ID_06635 [Conexivisphaera sp.]